MAKIIHGPSRMPKRPARFVEEVPRIAVTFYNYGLWLLPRVHDVRTDKWHPPFAWKKYLDERPTKAEINVWAKKYDPVLWSVITGHDAMVVEFDGTEGLATMKRLGLQPHIISPSGGGHVYFETPPGALVRGAPRIDPNRFPGMDLLAYGQTATFYGKRPDGSYRRPKDAAKEFYTLDDLTSPTQKELRELIRSRQFKPKDLEPPELPKNFADFVASHELLGGALKRSTSEGRNSIGFILARDLRDEGLDFDEVAEVVVDQYQPLVAQINGKKPYTADEAYGNVISAFTQPPRLPRRLFLQDDVQRMDQVHMEKIHWLWLGWLAEGKLQLLDGGKGRLKSTITISLAAKVSTGSPMPEGKVKTEPGGIIFFQNEDDAEDTLKPKLLAAGAYLRNIWVIPARHDADGRLQPIAFPEDLSYVEDKIRQFKKERKLRVMLVVVDPITGHLSERIQSHNDASIRRALVPLAQAASETKTSILLIRHFNKDTSMSAEHRGGGSIAFPAICRVHMLVEWSQDNPSVGVLACVNNNISVKPPSLSYEAEECTVEADGIEVTTWRIRWGDPVDVTADQLLTKPDNRKRSPVTDELILWLQDTLSAAPDQTLAVEDLKKAFKDAGYTNWSTLDKAARRIGVIRTAAREKGRPGVVLWAWQLPALGRGIIAAVED